MVAWSTPDLSDITQVVKGLIETGINQSSLNQGNIKVLCDAPDTARISDGNCHLTLYLLHVGRDPFWRNTPLQGSKAQLNNAQPLSLNLSYLLTAWCDQDFTSEQQAMSIALQTIHSNPIVTQDLIASELLSQWLPAGEFVMSIEADTIEEMSRLWQAITVPMRLSALIKVGVIFVAPLEPVVIDKPMPNTVNLAVAPELIEPASPPGTPPVQALLFDGFGLQAPPDNDAVTVGPLVAAGMPPPNLALPNGGVLTYLGGQPTLVIAGNGLDLAVASKVYLSQPGGSEWEVSDPWRQSVVPNLLELALPDVYADPTVTPPPAATPLPGVYLISVGDGGTVRSNALPLVIAPRVDNLTNPPTLSLAASGFYEIDGAGFAASGSTAVNFGTVALGFVAAASPAAGKFVVSADGTKISFLPPTGSAVKTAYPIALSVNGIAAPTGWVVQL